MISSNSFTIYNASAGSGKTYTLVKQYLLLLLRDSRSDAYKNILAITFTNKAVAEMKTRVISNLSSLASEPCPEDCRSLMKDLEKETGFTPEKIRTKSRIILKSILHNYASFDISTIDRFTHKIIRTFAKDLGIPVNFEVELNILQVLQEAVDRLINRAGEEKDLTRVLVNFTLSKADEDKSWDIARDIFNFSRILLQEGHQKYVRSLKGRTLQDYQRFSRKIKSEVQRTESQISEFVTAFFSIVEGNNLERLDFKRGSVFDYFKKLKEQNYNCSFGAKWQENLEEDKLYAAKLPDSKKTVLDQFQQEIVLLFNASKAAIYRREYLKEIYSNITPISLLSEVAAEIDNIKKERSLVLISDFNPTIAAEVQNQPAPFIYERLGERYRNYFIDEFQDTSQMQWENIIPLIDHALSSEVLHNETAGLTLVGDAKQSIYRFRGGKAEQFIGLYNDDHPFTIKRTVFDLPYNFRSAGEIVEFNNSFFEFISQKFTHPAYKELFENSKQLPRKESGGYVNISFLESDNVKEANEIHPQKIYEIMEGLLESGTPISEICILTRTRIQSFAVANFLSEKGISIVSSESLLVSNAPEVHFITAILEFSINPTDKNVKWTILNFMADRLDIADPHSMIAAQLELHDQEFFNWLTNYQLHFELQQLRELSLYEAVEYIIRCFSLIETSNAYVQFFLDFIFERSGKNPISVNEFLELWEQNKEKLSITAPRTKDAVQIMTIHKSKGLEFPVVIYPFANTKIKDLSKEHLWLPLPEELAEIPFSYFKASKKMLNWGTYEAAAYQQALDQSEFDAINILYVAFTRASRQLYILSSYDLKNGQEYEDQVSGLLIGYLKSRNKWTGQQSYEFGENKDAQAISPAEESIHPSRYFSSSTQNELVKLVTRSGSMWGSHQEEAINTGNLVHNILSEIDAMEDLSATLEKYLEAGAFLPAQETGLRDLLSQVMSHPELKNYYSVGSTVYRERDIISPSGEILRPDRLNFEGKNVSIIDYKTGKNQHSHGEQMQRYSDILCMMGYTVTNKILIYINNEVNVTFV